MCKTPTCIYCGTEFERKAQQQEFCSTPCRKAWNNQRMLRGAELYDMFMAVRFERKTAKVLGLWTLMCRLAMYWREEDLNKSCSRSWRKPHDAKERSAWALATVVHRQR